MYTPGRRTVRPSYITYGSGDSRDPTHLAATTTLRDVLVWIEAIDMAGDTALTSFEQSFMRSARLLVPAMQRAVEHEVGSVSGAELFSARRRVVLFRIMSKLAEKVEGAAREHRNG